MAMPGTQPMTNPNTAEFKIRQNNEDPVYPPELLRVPSPKRFIFSEFISSDSLTFRFIMQQAQLMTLLT